MTLVSAIVPVFNRADVLRNAVHSVLTQSHTNLELVVVDDGSTEDIAAALGDVLHRPNVSLVRHETNRGAAAARNTGVEHATGQYVAFLDSDDQWRPEKLSHQLQFMTLNPSCRASCTGYALFGKGMSGTERQPPAMSTLDDLIWGCRISPGTTLMAERSLFALTGPHDESLLRLEDWDWLLLAAKYTPIGGLGETLADVHHDRYAHVDDAQLRDAARKMAAYAREGRYGLSRGQRMILMSALQYELAAMSYRKGRFGAAMGALAASIAYCPWKRPAHILAALNAVGSDVGRAFRARRGSQ